MGCIKPNGIDRGTHKKRLCLRKEISVPGPMPKGWDLSRGAGYSSSGSNLFFRFLVAENTLKINLHVMWCIIVFFRSPCLVAN